MHLPANPTPRSARSQRAPQQCQQEGPRNEGKEKPLSHARIIHSGTHSLPVLGGSRFQRGCLFRRCPCAQHAFCLPQSAVGQDTDKLTSHTRQQERSNTLPACQSIRISSNARGHEPWIGFSLKSVESDFTLFYILDRWNQRKRAPPVLNARAP